MMKKIKLVVSTALPLVYLSYFIQSVWAQDTALTPVVIVDQKALGFLIPSLSTVLTFAVRTFFIIAGLAALLFLLMGALAWVTSGGNKESVDKARDKITNAVIGVVLIAVVLAVIVTLEKVVFGGSICFGLSCSIKIPGLVQPCGVGTNNLNCTPTP